MRDRLPAERILSHDVIESGLVTTGAVCDAIVGESLPKTHVAYSVRQRRWIRGDWQNIPFIFGKKGKWPRVSHFGRAIIVQNVVCSLVPAALVVLLAVVAVSDVKKCAWILLLSTFPTLVNIALRCMRGRDSSYKKMAGAAYMLGDLLRGSVMRVMVTFHEAVANLDAITRSLIRFITNKHLMEWESSFSAEQSVGNGLRHTSIKAVAICGALLMLWISMFPLKRSIPLLVLSALWTMGSFLA